MEIIAPLFLRTFRKAYELRNFTQAARQLGMTQSGVSQHVAQIEEILKIPLFERVGRGLFPTPAADRLYSFGGAWLSQMEELIHELQDEKQRLAGRVVLGAPGSFGVYLLKSLVDWQSRNPGLTIDFEYGPSSVMERELRAGRMDIAVTSEPLDPRFFANEEFFQQEYVLISHPDLKPDLDSFESFCQMPFVDYVGSEGIFQKWLGAHFRKQAATRMALNVRARINNMESIFYLLLSQVGFTIFPSEPLVELVAKRKLKIHRTAKTVKNPLFLVQRQGQILPRRVEALRDLILNLTAP